MNRNEASVMRIAAIGWIPVAISLASCGSSLFPCDSQVLQRIASPSGSNAVAMVQVDCWNFDGSLEIHRLGEDGLPAAGGKIYSSHFEHKPWQRVNVHWEGESSLVISHPPGTAFHARSSGYPYDVVVRIEKAAASDGG